MTEEAILQEAKRCFNCPNPRCVEGCPVRTHIPQFIHALTEDKVNEAAEILNSNNFFSAITCRVCDQQHQCEGNCIQGIRGTSIAIGNLEQYANDKGNFVPQVKSANGKKVAVIGSGPSGLAFANIMSLNGFAVTVFEKEKLLGGMVRYGIPDFRLDKKILDNLITKLEKQGVKFITNKEVEGSKEVLELAKEFDYIYLAAGAGVSKFMGIDGDEIPEDIYGATEFLSLLNGHDAVAKECLRTEFSDKKAVVVGGGNVAMDAARCAQQLGAKVTVVYRRTEIEMPARPDEYADAKAEGIVFSFLTNPAAVVREGGRVVGLRCDQMQLGEPDSSGRASVTVAPNSSYVLACDKVIFAVGQKPSWPEGKVKVDENGLTDRPNIYAGGDLVTGPATVVEAIAAANKAVQNILNNI